MRGAARLLVLAGLVSACPDPAPRASEVTAQLVSAATVRRDGEGHLRYGFDASAPVTLRIAPAAEVVVRWSAATLACRGDDANGARLVTCEAPKTPGSATLDVLAGGVSVARWAAEVVSDPDQDPVIREAKALAAKGDLTRAVDLLSRTSTAASLPSLWRAVTKARLLYAHATMADALAPNLAAAQLAVQLGVVSEAGRRYRAAAHIASRLGRFEAAVQALARAEAVTPDLLLDAARTLGERAGLQLDLERYREAERLYLEAIDATRDAGATDDEVAHASALALLYARLGRFAEARGLLAEYAPSAQTPPRVAGVLFANRAELEMRTSLAGRPASEDVDGLLEEAERRFHAAGALSEAADRQVERAAWAALREDTEAARRHLEGAGEGETTASLRALTQVRLAMLEGRWRDATEGLDEIEETLAEDPEAALEARAEVHALRSELARARGRPRAAAQHATHALRALERLGRAASVHRSASALLGQHDALRRAAVEAWAAAGSPARALIAGDGPRGDALRRLKAMGRLEGRAQRASRAPLLDQIRRGCAAPTEADNERCEAQLQAGLHQWARRAARRYSEEVKSSTAALSIDALRRSLGPRRGLLVLERSADARRGLWLEGDAVRTATSAGFDGPWLRALSATEHVFVVSDEPSALPALMATRQPGAPGPTFSLVPFAGWLTWTTTVSAGPPVVLADLSGERADALAQGRFVAERLGAELYTSAAPPPDVTLVLGRASGLHFAGHGVLLGADPWSTFLDLGPQGALTLEDILTAQPKLRWAVLSGCDTAARSGPGQVGLPQALLAVGTRTVVGTTQPVLDSTARRFTEAFYEAGGARRPGPAFRAAIDALRRQGSAWTAFRLWGWP